MTARDRISKYRGSGGGADLTRVEVLVPAAHRDEIIALAAQFRKQHRERNTRLQALLDHATSLYGNRIADNIDLSKLNDLTQRARVIAKAVMERGDARAFVLGRQILDAVEN